MNTVSVAVQTPSLEKGVDFVLLALPAFLPSAISPAFLPKIRGRIATDLSTPLKHNVIIKKIYLNG